MTWTQKYTWWPKALRLKVGLLKRPQPDVPHMTEPKWHAEIVELGKFQTWVLWRHDGARPPRPSTLKGWRPEPVYWDVLHQYMTVHPVAPPPPPPPPPPDNPPSRWHNAPWTKPHIDISYGIRKDDPVWTIDRLIELAVENGAKAIGGQVGNDCPDPDWAYNLKAPYQKGKQAGLQVYGWGRADYFSWAEVKTAVRSVMPLDGFSADIEGRCQDQSMPEHLRDEFADEMPLSVVPTGAIDQSLDNLSPPEIGARWGDYFDYRGQDYLKQGAEVTPDVGENFVWWRSTAHVAHGFRHLPDAGGHWHVPLVMPNAETCPPLSVYEPLLQGYAPHFGVWIAELLERWNEWPVFKRLATTP